VFDHRLLLQTLILPFISCLTLDSQLTSTSYFLIYEMWLRYLTQRVLKFLFVCFETGSHYVTQAGLKIVIIRLDAWLKQ
jgi:hypothetical protein